MIIIGPINFLETLNFFNKLLVTKEVGFEACVFLLELAEFLSLGVQHTKLVVSVHCWRGTELLRVEVVPDVAFASVEYVAGRCCNRRVEVLVGLLDGLG